MFDHPLPKDTKKEPKIVSEDASEVPVKKEPKLNNPAVEAQLAEKTARTRRLLLRGVAAVIAVILVALAFAELLY